jgi:hypothetical protein
MKIMLNKTVRPIRAVKPATVRTPSAKLGTGKREVLVKSQVDRYVGYVGHRVPTAAIVAKIIGLPIPRRLNSHGYLVVTGDKPGILVHEVRTDDDANFYQRVEGGLYGSVDALNASGNKGFKAEIVDKLDLLNRAKKLNKPTELTCVKSGERVKVFLLNPLGEQYFAGITMRNNKLVVLNMEGREPWNKKDVQYVDPKAIKLDFSKMFARA